MKQIWFIFLFISVGMFAQIEQKQIVIKNIIPTKDTIVLENSSITPFNFELKDSLLQKIDTSKYKIEFSKSILIIKDASLFGKKIQVKYQKFPDFLTKTYQALDTSLIVQDTKNDFRLYHSKILDKKEKQQLFNGLETKGNIVRGIRFGNNQDGVLDSNLALQIQGNLSEKVKIRANIQDSNIPVQNNGYTQRLDEYDKIFIELFSKKWQVIAGDLPFENYGLKYLRFKKRVQGLSVKTTLGDSIKNKNFYVSGAVVRGKFTSIKFNGQNGNQGPYNIINQENAYWLIVSNSETVYVNGFKVERGKDKDYTIDYNTAEIYFNPTFPINATMRIVVDFQISDQSYTRFASFNEMHLKNKKTFVQVSLYNENDLKNSAINQNLTQEQLEVLKNAGDQETQMVVPSAVLEEYDPDKIQYKKEIQNNTEIFVFSNNPNDQLYHVNFTYVGKNNGDYIINEVLANGKVFNYITPIGNEKQGSYSPVTKLKAPNKLQLLNLKSAYKPSEKTDLKSELSYSYFDKNLFSNLQDNDNSGFAGNIAINQKLIDKKWQLATKLYSEIISKNFKTVERIQNVEFNRDWNINTNSSNNQRLLNLEIKTQKDSVFNFIYNFKNLNIHSVFNGNKHEFKLQNQLKNWRWSSDLSLLNTNAITEISTFINSNNSVKYQLKNKWIGSEFGIENNHRKDKQTKLLNNLSFKNQFLKAYFGFGDKNKIFAEFGSIFRKNDSIQNNKFNTFEKAKNFYLKSKLIQHKKANLSFYANYEINESVTHNKTKFLNTQLLYQQKLFKNTVNFSTEYQTSSGNLPQQDYQFIEVEPGHGYYQWIDYNNDNIKDLDEFEIAVFQDQANYLKIALPTIKYIKVNQNKINSALSINLNSILKTSNFRKFISHFSNQLMITTDVKRKKDQEFIHINPFDDDKESVLSLLSNFRNNLNYNQGKQHFSTTYSYLESKNNALFISGFQKNTNKLHRLDFIHLIKKQWLLKLQGLKGFNKSEFEIFLQRNFEISKHQFNFNLDYLQSKKLKLGFNAEVKNMVNHIGNKEQLKATILGAKIRFTKNDKASFMANFKWINNNFNGNTLSAVAYQMLEGLQNGKNYTWQFLAQKKINSFLDLNINYQGRKSSTSKTIHVGNIQLRAVF